MGLKFMQNTLQNSPLKYIPSLHSWSNIEAPSNEAKHM